MVPPRSDSLLRPMEKGEERILDRLLHEAVHRLTTGDYDANARNAWSPEGSADPARLARIAAACPTVLTVKGVVVAFGDLQPDGCITFLYVHPDHIGQGHAGRLLEHLMTTARARGLTRVYSNVSLTAEPFFRSRGFRVVRRQAAERHGVKLPNARMERSLNPRPEHQGD